MPPYRRVVLMSTCVGRRPHKARIDQPAADAANGSVRGAACTPTGCRGPRGLPCCCASTVIQQPRRLARSPAEGGRSPSCEQAASHSCARSVPLSAPCPLSGPHLGKGVEDVFQLVLGDADACIVHRHRHRLAAVRHVRLHPDVALQRGVRTASPSVCACMSSREGVRRDTMSRHLLQARSRSPKQVEISGVSDPSLLAGATRGPRAGSARFSPAR